MSEPNVDELELKAREEREHLHRSVEELKSQVTQVRESFDPRRNARKYFLAASVAASLLGFLSGYKMAGIFTE